MKKNSVPLATAEHQGKITSSTKSEHINKIHQNRFADVTSWRRALWNQGVIFRHWPAARRVQPPALSSAPAPTVWSLRKHQHPRLSFCSTELRDGVKWDINPGLNVSLFSSSIVYKWRLGAILSERIVCVKTKAHLNARRPSFESATALTVKHWTVDLMMFVTLLVNYSGRPYCVYESNE